MPLITASQAIQKLPTDVNFSEEKLAANIPAAEYRWGMLFLGASFWTDLLANIGTKTEYKVLWQQVLWDYLAWAVLYESRLNIQWSISTAGFMLNSTEYSQSDVNGYKNISALLYDRLQLMQQRLNTFLTTYPTKFPLYGPNAENGQPEFIEDYFGVNVEVCRHKDSCTTVTEPDFPAYVVNTEGPQQFNIDCAGTIRITGVYKNDVLQDTGLPKDFASKADVLAYLQAMDAGWSLAGNYVSNTSTDVWNVLVCCIGSVDAPLINGSSETYLGTSNDL